MTNLEELKNKLRELFQFDRSDLDFGIYRIMNQKKEEVEKFLDQDLIPQVKTEFDQYKSNEKSALIKELDGAVKQAKDLGMDPDQAPKVKELKEKIKASVDISALENEVYSYLYSFFSRYYDKGDFISLRRYKKDTYSIPYEGEEVKLYWANHDQYYIKSSENFKNYRFKLSNGKSVNFNLAEATTEKNNNKSQDGKERRFYLAEDNIVEINADELTINFIYDLNDEKQEILKNQAVGKIIETIKTGGEKYKDFYEMLALKPTEKDKNRTLLEKHLNDYVAKNTFDYFIHKDLGNFLRRELDFFIKNEVLFIDDLDTENERKFDAQISTVKVIKKIGHKIIAFLEQLENFQKKLWLKKKFVYGTNYCMTLDYVPEEFYPEIASNKDQVNEWINLFAINEIKANSITPGFSDAFSSDGSIRKEEQAIKFLKDNPQMLLDTKFLSEETKENILSRIDRLDERTNGVLINSDNFHAVSLLIEKYKNKVDCVYIDPPYNAKSSEILYKNTFKHASWASLMENRLNLSKKLTGSNGSSIIAVDENEQERLGMIISQTFHEQEKTCVSIVHNKKGIQGSKFSFNHEYAYFITPENIELNDRSISEDEWDYSNLRNWGNESLRSDARNCFYPIYVKEGKICGFGEVSPSEFHPSNSNLIKEDQVIEVYPIDKNGVERKWRYARASVERIIDLLKIDVNPSGIVQILKAQNSAKVKTVWTDSKYIAGDYGTKVLTNMGFPSKSFDFPKSIYTVKDCVSVITDDEATVLDYFAGSGTTAQSVMLLNDEGSHIRYILVEMGKYFSNVTKPRVLKSIFSRDWKDGLPKFRNGYLSQIVKYYSLEQYEDALENLNLNKPEAITLALDESPKMREDYTLNYMLDVEAKESDSLLNLEKFEDPFNYKMKIIKDNEIIWEKMDLVETFNYLIGITVDHIDSIRGFRTVAGTLPDGKKALVIWRNLKEKTNADLDEFCQKQDYTSRDSEFDVIYVNGDNNLINVEDDEAQRFKVVLIEDEFKKRMFETEEV